MIDAETVFAHTQRLAAVAFGRFRFPQLQFGFGKVVQCRGGIRIIRRERLFANSQRCPIQVCGFPEQAACPREASEHEIDRGDLERKRCRRETEQSDGPLQQRFGFGHVPGAQAVQRERFQGACQLDAACADMVLLKGDRASICGFGLVVPFARVEAVCEVQQRSREADRIGSDGALRQGDNPLHRGGSRIELAGAPADQGTCVV
ncbi:MAG: hypothetical protein BWY66_01796 [bacterium ADurb.Bin374]|nr:MAG: hypothetical protein BWY66_01796 [bacterium ADurb.Bin374]